MADPNVSEIPDLHDLTAIFFADLAELGRFEPIVPRQMPQVYRELLAHHSHMTVTVERFHESPVDVRVLARHRTGQHYSRKILLTRQSDGRVVQFGIVRLDFETVSQAVREEIEREQTPLGRVLIEHGVLREVELKQLYRIACGPELAADFGLPLDSEVFGRTALIYCDGEPCVELLEIVTLP
jgi:chorismate-pyruvate lyase